MSSARWSEVMERGNAVLVGENELAVVRIVPERGSKIVSLIDKRTGRDWIHRTDRPWEKLRYGMIWDEGDRGGWDEMFPTIETCACPDEPWTDKRFPDHGEVWCLPWRYSLEASRAHLSVEGVQVPYVLSKTVSLEGSELRIDYRLDNPTPFAFSYLWAAHPLLDVRPGMVVKTEPAAGPIQVSYSHGDRLGRFGDRNSFPIAAGLEGERIDLSVLESGAARAAEKYYFAEPLSQGYAELVDPSTGESIAFRFSPDENPYLAVWAHYGAFDDYTFAFEPASGYLDSVQTAHELAKVKQVQGHSANVWTLAATLGLRE